MILTFPSRLTISALAVGAAVLQTTERMDVFVASRDHPAIAYSTTQTSDAIAVLDRQLAAGARKLSFDPQRGYLPAVLESLRVPVESQALVFSQTSAQADQISMKNPRAIYFNDTTAVGWVPGADVLELAVHDARQGAIFYTLAQKPAATPRFERQQGCLTCHLTWDTLGVPGFTVLSTFPMSDDPNAYANGVTVDHRTPFQDRWGGWFVTGDPPDAHHLGNRPVVVPRSQFPPDRMPAPRLATIASVTDSRRYPGACSDVVAQMVLGHQAQALNLITRVGWEARLAAAPGAAPSAGARVEAAIDALVDYFLFVDEAPLVRPVRGSCGFDRLFAAAGPVDRRGRSLRQLDLTRRLMKYPCSYTIYSPAFDALAEDVRLAVFRSMWAILSGKNQDQRYAHLSAADRLAIVEILRDTREDAARVFEGTTG